MKKKIVGSTVTILVAVVVLMISLVGGFSQRLAYSPMVLSEKADSLKVVTIDYALSYQGKIGPDNPLWYIKVMRDKVWQIVTFNPLKKAELNLLFSDKRLNSSLELFKNNKPDLGLSTLTKSGKYLENAEALMTENWEFYRKIALASLKHREVIENEILPMSPEDIRPEVIKANDYSKEVYKKVRDHMLSKGQVPPENPFEMD